MKKIIFFGLLLLLLSMTPTQAQGQPPIQADISVGFDGQCKYGYWIPVHLTLSNQGDDFSGNFVISYSQANHSFPLTLATNARKTFSTIIYLDDKNISQQFEFSIVPESGKAIPLPPVKLNCSATRLVGVMTDTRSAFTALNALQPANTTDVAYIDAATLPENWLGLQAMDVLIISNTDATKLDEKQRTAIRTWTQHGGQLIFGAGAQWQSTLAGFEDLLPMQITGARTQDINLSFGASTEGINLPDVVLLEGKPDKDAKLLFGDQRTPLVAQRPLSVGNVTLLTFDPNINTFRAWDQIINFYDYILIRKNAAQDFSEVRNWDALINATSRFDGLTLPSTSMIFGLLLLYITLVGPAQYLVLKRLKKLERSWVTIPAITLIFTLSLIFTGWDLRGSKPRINQLAVVHHWAGDKDASLGGYVGIFSPRRGSYAIVVDGDFIPQPFAPHYYYDTPDNEWNFTLRDNAFLAETVIGNAEIMPIGLRGSIPAPQINANLTLTLNENDIQLTGSIENQSEIPLTGCVLVYPGGFEKIGDIGVGQEKSLSLPIDLLGATNFNVSAAAASGFYTAYSTGPDIYLSDLFQDSVYSDHQASKKHNLLASVYGSYQLPAVGFMSVCWDESQVPYALSLPKYETDTESLTAYLTSLQVDISAEDGQLTIPPVFFHWYIPEGNHFSYDSPYDLYFAYEDSAEIYYGLSTPIDYTQVDQLILHLEGDSSQRSDFPLNVYLWHPEEEAWILQDVADWGDFIVPDPEHYISEKGGDIRIRLDENSNGGGTFDVTRVDFSLVVAQ